MFFVAFLLTLGFVQIQAASTNSFRLTVESQDVSRIIAKCGAEKFEFHSEILGEMKLRV